MSFRLVQISDTHLSPSHDHFQDNFDTLQSWLQADAPDLIINTGDISLDGADHEADLAHARAQHARLPARCLLLPGNHDVGDYHVLGGRQPVHAARLARWTRLVGADHFVEDIPGWRLIGLNTQILGSGLPAEAAQWQALEAAVAGAGARALALFMHKPLCQQRLADAEVTYWPVLEPARSRIVAAFGSTPPRFVASGHIHQWRDRLADGLRQIWAPPVSFIVGGVKQEIIGNKMLGAVHYHLHPDGEFEAAVISVPGLVLHDIALLPQIYGASEKVS